MSGFGLAATTAFTILRAWVAGVAASTLPVALADDPPFLEWFIRTFISFLKIALTFPKGALVTGFDILVALLGEKIAERSEVILRTVTSFPQIFELLSGVLSWLKLPLILAMVYGTASYWSAYTNQSGKSRRLFDKIWEGKTLIVDPLSWTKRAAFISAVLTVSIEILRMMVDGLWNGLNWLIDYIYADQGTTMGAAFESTLMNLVDTGGVGFIVFLVVFACFVYYGFKLLWKFLGRIRDFVIGTGLFFTDLGLYLDGSKLSTISEPVKKYLKAFLWIALTVFFAFMAPLAAAKVGNWPGLLEVFSLAPLVSALFFLIFLELAAEFPKHFERWGFSNRALASVAQRINSFGDWIDQDIEGLAPRPATDLPNIGDLKNRAIKALTDQIPQEAKTAAEVALKVGQLHPETAAAVTAIQGVREYRKRMKDTDFVAGEIAGSLWRQPGSSAAPAPSPQWDREFVFASAARKRPQIMEMVGTFSTNRDYAVFFELVRTYHTAPQMERIDVIKSRIEAQLEGQDDSVISDLAERGRKIEEYLRH